MHRGFNHILREESKTILDMDDSRLMLNTLVKKIIYNQDNVTVLTFNNDVIVADYAICTFSQSIFSISLCYHQAWL